MKKAIKNPLVLGFISIVLAAIWVILEIKDRKMPREPYEYGMPR